MTAIYANAPFSGEEGVFFLADPAVSFEIFPKKRTVTYGEAL